MDIPSLTSSEWSVLVALCRYASNDDHTCFPSLEVVAKVAHLTLRTVQRTMPSLVERKLITIREKANGRGHRNKFKINATLLRELKSKDDTTTSFMDGDEEESTQTKGDTVTPFVEQERVTLSPLKGDIVTLQRVTPCRLKGDIDASYIGRICQESVRSESVSESVSLVLTPVEIPSPRGEKKAPDTRTKPFREALKKYYTEKAKMAMGWDERDGKQLSAFLAAYPSLTIDDWQTILEHRAQSEGVTHSQRACYWLARAADYMLGPLDRYNKPRNGGNTNGNGKQSRDFTDIADTSRDALEILERMDTPAYLSGGSNQTRSASRQIRESAPGQALGSDTPGDR
jgi:hypothetical protein